MRAPTLKANNLYYSQLDPKLADLGKSIESKSNSKPKPKGSIEDKISQNVVEFSLKDIKSKAKNTTIDYIKKVLKIQTLSVQLFNKIQAIDTARQLTQIFDLVFSIIVESMKESNKKVQLNFRQPVYQQVKQQGGIAVAIRSKQAKLLRIIKQDQIQGESPHRGKTAKKLQQCLKTNQNLKKQLYTLKEERQTLQKRIVSLVQQFQNRKNFYLAEIKKLTDIIKMSTFEVRNLVLQKTKEAKVMQNNRQEKDKDQKMATEKPQSQLQIIEDQGLRNYNIPTIQKLVERNSFRENIGTYNGYNTQIRPLRNATSIQFQLEKGDNFLP